MYDSEILFQLRLVITSVMQLLSRHSDFSIVLITQNLYEQGKECRNIRFYSIIISRFDIELRLNADLIALGKNYADSSLNLRFARSIGLEEEYRTANDEIKNDKFNFILINNSQSCPSTSFRVGTHLTCTNCPPCFYIKSNCL